MNATKKLALSLALLVAASVFTIVSLAKERKPAAGNGQNAGLILYYRTGCPHCVVVENYIQQNDLAQKLGIAEKEVGADIANQDEFFANARICGLDLANLGVPTLFDPKTSKCYEGDQPIIDFLKQAGS